MLKKYAMKVSNTLSTINYVHRPAKDVSSSSDDDGSRCSYDSNYDQTEVLNRNLFIENYLIGRGVQKARSSSMSEDAFQTHRHKDGSLKRNNRRKSLMEKRDDRLKINRNCLFIKQNDDKKLRHHYDDEKCVNYDYIKTSAAPTSKKISNIYQEFVDFELSIVTAFKHFFHMSKLEDVVHLYDTRDKYLQKENLMTH